MKEKYLIYLRKSRQDNEYETVQEVLARHERQLQEYAAKTFGYRIPEEDIYREVVSGETIEDRPQIKKVFERMQNEDITGVMVIESSRLTRGDLLDCGTVVHIFRYTNTLIVTPQKSYNLEIKYDRKFFEMELTKGNDYLEYTKEVLTRGREASTREGNYIGSIAPFGYKIVWDKKSPILEINEQEAPFIQMIFEMYANGAGANSIAHKINDLGAKPRKKDFFTAMAIRQILENPVYLGKMRYKFKPQKKVYENGKIVKKRVRNADCELIEGKHEAIISEELYKRCQEQKNRVSREKPSTELANMFAGILKCKKCGMGIGLRPHRKDGVKYRKDRYYCRTGIYCENKTANAEDVNKIIVNALMGYLNDFEIKASHNTSDVVKSQEALKTSLQMELAKLEKRQEDLYDLLESGIYTRETFVKRNEKLATERKRLQEAIDNIYIPEANDYQEKAYKLHHALELLADKKISAKTKNTFLKEIIEVIYYEKDVNNKDSKDLSNIKIEIILK